LFEELVLTGSMGRVAKGFPYDTELKLTGIHPVPSVFLYVDEAEQ
jgi:hypothetical protein